MNIDIIADAAMASLKRDLKASKFTPEEWAEIDYAVNVLADTVDVIPHAHPSHLRKLEIRMRLAKSTLRNYSIAKSIEVEGAVAKAINDAFRDAVGVGMATLAKVLVG